MIGWFSFSTALWNGVLPSLILKSRWAPPLIKAWMTSPLFFMDAVMLNGVSVQTDDNINNTDFQLLENKSSISPWSS